MRRNTGQEGENTGKNETGEEGESSKEARQRQGWEQTERQEEEHGAMLQAWEAAEPSGRSTGVGGGRTSFKHLSSSLAGQAQTFPGARMGGQHLLKITCSYC